MKKLLLRKKPYKAMNNGGSTTIVLATNSTAKAGDGYYQYTDMNGVITLVPEAYHEEYLKELEG